MKKAATRPAQGIPDRGRLAGGVVVDTNRPIVVVVAVNAPLVATYRVGRGQVAGIVVLLVLLPAVVMRLALSCQWPDGAPMSKLGPYRTVPAPDPQT